MNLYGYVGNDPVNGTDSTGMCDSRDQESQTACDELIKNVLDPKWRAETIDLITNVASEVADAAANLIQAFHGTKMENVESIKADGALKPTADGEIYLSGNQADTFVHGVDTSVGGCVSCQVTVDISQASSVENVSVPGNPNTILIKTDVPLPTTVDSVTIRRPDGEGGFKYEKQ